MSSKVQNGITQQNWDKLVKNIFLKYTCIFNESQVEGIICNRKHNQIKTEGYAAFSSAEVSFEG